MGASPAYIQVWIYQPAALAACLAATFLCHRWARTLAERHGRDHLKLLGRMAQRYAGKVVAGNLALAAFCWLGMQWVHEAGHVIGGTLSQGTVDRVVLAPWTFSRTDMDLDPHPLITAWGGPVIGALFPLLVFLLFRKSNLMRVFAGFCLLANGAYLFYGAFQPIADAAVLRRHGAPTESLLAFGAASLLIATLLLWKNRGGFPWEILTPASRISAGVLAAAMAVAGACWFPGP